MTGKQGWIGSVLLQKGGQLDVRAQDAVKRNALVQLSVRVTADSEPIQLSLVHGEVDELIRHLQKAKTAG